MTLTPENRRLRGLRASNIEIDKMIKRAQAACQPYGKREGRRLDWWKGQLHGLILAECMLVYADYPDVPYNAERIESILNEYP